MAPTRTARACRTRAPACRRLRFDSPARWTSESRVWSPNTVHQTASRAGSETATLGWDDGFVVEAPVPTQPAGRFRFGRR